jgi:hypothetical protein
VKESKRISKEMDKLEASAHDNIDYETLLEYGLSESDRERYYVLQEELFKAEDKEKKVKK